MGTFCQLNIPHTPQGGYQWIVRDWSLITGRGEGGYRTGEVGGGGGKRSLIPKRGSEKVLAMPKV